MLLCCSVGLLLCCSVALLLCGSVAPSDLPCDVEVEGELLLEWGGEQLQLLSSDGELVEDRRPQDDALEAARAHRGLAHPLAVPELVLLRRVLVGAQ